jgi:hypothetical protein
LLEGGSLLDYIYRRGADPMAFAIAFMFSPLCTTLGLAVAGALWGFTFTQAKGHPWPAKISGAFHGLAHILLCCALFAWIVIALSRTPMRPGGVWFSLTLMSLLFVLGCVLGSLLFAGYLWLSSRWTGVHSGDLFSSMAITDCKHFLRMRLDADGKLTVFVVGLKKVPGDWTFEAPGDRCGRPWFQSKKFMVEEDYSPFVVEKIELK